MKTYYCILFSFIVSFQQAFASDIQNNIIPGKSEVIGVYDANQGTGVLDILADFLTGTIFGIIAIVAVGVFLYLGAKLAFARGNPEEFKKTMMGFVYAVIGIIVVSLAWLVVRLVAGIDL